MTHSVSHRARSLAFPLLGTLFAAAVAAVPGGCSPTDTVKAQPELINDSTQALDFGDVTSLQGTYTTCVQRSGAWTLTVMGSPATNELSVVAGDSSCELAITAVVTTTTTYDAGGPLALDQDFQSSAVAFAETSAPTAFYANGFIAPADFSTAFTVFFLYSDDPNLVPGAVTNTPTYTSVTSSSALIDVTAPDYAFADGIDVTSDAENNVTSVSGSIMLTPNFTDGQSFVVYTGTLSGFGAIDAAFNAGTQVALSGLTIDSSYFTLSSTTLPQTRTLIVQNLGVGVPAYELYQITFDALVANGVACTVGEECGSSFCVAAVCCNSACDEGGSCSTGTCE